MSKNRFPRLYTEEKDFLRHPSSIDDFPATSHCFATIIYLISPINRELMPIYQSEQSGPDQILLPVSHMISFSNGCALIPQPEALENVSRVIIHYSNMK